MLNNQALFDHDKLNFRVEKIPLFREEHSTKTVFPITYGTIPDNCIPTPTRLGMGLQRTDTGEVLSIVSEDRPDHQYLSMVKKIEEGLWQSGINLNDVSTTTDVYDNGAQLQLGIQFNAYALDIGGGDIVKPRLLLRDSHNGKWALNGMMGAFRSSCWNTLVVGDKLAHIYMKHTAGLDVSSFASKVGNAAKYIGGEGYEMMRKWYRTPVNREQAIDLFTKTLAQRMDNVTRKKVANKVMLSNLMKIFDEENRHLHGNALYEKYATRDEGSLWTAYNAATHWSTHTNERVRKDNSKPFNVRVTREEQVRKMLKSDTWNTLALAA